MEKKKKVSKTYKPANFDYTVLATVPYQLCPKCGGDGTVMVQNWNGSPTSISNGLQTCNLCGGAMIIPMHIVSTECKMQGYSSLFLTYI
jgi:hypothetical protein